MAMEVGIRQEVCNNLTAKWSSPENWWRSNMHLLPCRFHLIAWKACRMSYGSRRSSSEARSGAGFSADLGYSSKYSNELHVDL